MASLNIQEAKTFIEEEFTKSALPALMEYIKIPNLSRAYDVNWSTNGLLEKAALHIKTWIETQNLLNLQVELIQDQGKTPLLFVEVKGSKENSPTVFLYGHFDKQPHLEGWEEGLGPTLPVIRDGKLYGRGASDDGYSSFAAILSIKACQAQKIDHPRCVIFLEADEESGSQDLPYYLNKLLPRIGQPQLIICLDSGAGDYERLWLTTSLRGVIGGVLKIRCMSEEIHSGDASGVLPSTFRVLRMLLDRVDCVESGNVHDKFQVNIPADRYEEAYRGAAILGKDLVARMPAHKDTKTVVQDHFQLILNRVWKAQLTVTGIEGLPAPKVAGNVLKPFLNVKLSLRIPPTLDPKQAEKDLKELLEKNPPYDCEVLFEDSVAGSGWNTPPMSQALKNTLHEASKGFYGKEYESQGEGGSIPFMKMLSDLYPKAEFAVVGVLGPKSNAHGPNEFLHLDMCKKLIGCMSKLLAESCKLYA